MKHEEMIKELEAEEVYTRRESWRNEGLVVYKEDDDKLILSNGNDIFEEYVPTEEDLEAKDWEVV